MLSSLYQFQTKGIEFALSRHGRVLIGDEMGTGKSLQALGISYLYKADWPLLILAPSSLKLVWRDEVHKWLPNIPESQIEVVKCKKGAFQKHHQIYILSYNLAKSVQVALERMHFQVIIADEAHYLKSREAKRTKALSPILMQSKRVIMLSGTPMLGRPTDIYNIIHILRPDVFPSFREFGHRYCDPHTGKFGVDWKGAANTNELHIILTKTLMIRRLKSEVLQELPSKRKQRIEIEGDENYIKQIQKILDQMSLHDITETLAARDFEDEFIKEDKNNNNNKSPRNSIRDNIIIAYKLTGLAKVKSTIEFIGTLIENDIKFIVFAHHLEVLNLIEHVIKEKKIPYIRIDGSTPVPKRHELVSNFQNIPSLKIALLSLTVASQGITLTAASTVVFAELNWTPGIMNQAEDRIHRIGQENAVNIYYLYANNTLDTSIDNILKMKNEVVAKAIDGKESNAVEFKFPEISGTTCEDMEISHSDLLKLLDDIEEKPKRLSGEIEKDQERIELEDKSIKRIKEN